MNNLNKDVVLLEEDDEIDLLEIGKVFWKRRKLIFRICLIGVVLGIIVAISIPKEYTTTVILTPEITSKSTKGNVNALAAIAGVDLSSGSNTSELSPALYPDIASSTPFLMGLLEIQVTDLRKGIHKSLYDYLLEDQKAAWWSYIMRAPFQLISLFSSQSDSIENNQSSSKVISLTKEQSSIVNALGKRINVSVDIKTGVITLTSTMQNPKISATIADTITSYLQQYIISYRTLKARQDLTFSENLYKEAKTDYYKAQQKYASYIDENMGIISARYRTTQEQLQNEMNLAYSVYNQMAQQLQSAKIKVQDTTPVYKIIQPAVVPLKASSPKKILILIGFLFLAFVGVCGWVYIKDFFIMKEEDKNV
jgi:uncharacterized protein involved in exopolysaccharide biosynthesis